MTTNNIFINMETNLTILFFSLLPALVYSFIIYLTVPYKTIRFLKSCMYICVGLLSAELLKFFWVIYPDWHETTNIIVGELNNDNYFNYLHVYNFIQVGFIEEISKLIIFLSFNFYLIKIKGEKDHPISTMFFMGMISLGFSIIENIQYGLNSETPIDTLLWRSVTAVIGHMVFGLFMGYWISIGRMKSRLYDRSLLDIIINKRKGLRRIFYTLIGLISATILHGIYDLHLNLNGGQGISSLYILLIMSLLGVFWCFKNLNHLHYNEMTYLKNRIE